MKFERYRDLSSRTPKIPRRHGECEERGWRGINKLTHSGSPCQEEADRIWIHECEEEGYEEKREERGYREGGLRERVETQQSLHALSL